MFGELIEDLISDQDLRKVAKANLKREEFYPPLTSEDRVRASSIYDFCPRREALRHKHCIPTTRTVSASNAITYEFGYAFEKAIRDKILAKMGVLHGQWRCVKCEKIHQDPNNYARHPRPEACRECHHSNFSYDEEDLYDPISNVGGHPDGYVHHRTIRAILELKTIANYHYKEVAKEPMPRHVAQTQVYMHLAGYKRAYIWYFNKETSGDVAHWVHYDPAYARLLLEKGKSLKKYFQEKVLPEKICTNKEAPKAKSCKLCDICFATPKEVEPDVFA